MAPIPKSFCTLTRECPDSPGVILHHCGSGSRSVGGTRRKRLENGTLQVMEIALYEPDMAHNTGAILRLGACFSVPVHIIEPAGFDASDRALKRAALDYLSSVQLKRHASFDAFEAWRKGAGKRLILLTTKAKSPYAQFRFQKGDVLLLGRESAGVPQSVHTAADARLVIPLAPAMRSLNVATATSIVLGEALRQTGGFDR